MTMRARNNEYERVHSDDDDDDYNDNADEPPYNDSSVLDDNANDDPYSIARGGGEPAPSSSSSDEEGSRSSKNRNSRRRVAPPRRRGGHHDHHCWCSGRFVVGAASVAAAVTVSWTWAWADVYATQHLQNTDNDINSATSAPPNNASSTPGLGNNNMNLNSDNELIDNPRPHLHELIADFQTQITGNVSWLLDFALLGHAKCATTSHLNWLRTHPDIYMPRHEVASLRRGHPAELVSLLYALPNRPHKKRGYKNPLDIMDPRALNLIRLYWPSAKIVVGVRHPVWWFESYYNYNKRQHSLGISGAAHLGPAESLSIPRHVYFHRHLHLLGKTNGSDPHERALLESGDDVDDDSGSEPPPPPIPVMTNKVFLYESTQPFDVREGRSATYRDDLAKFLELTSPLLPIHLHGPTDGTTYYNYTSHDYHYAMDVCDDTYKPLRRQLLDVGTVASDWILRYFVGHPDVTVSSPDRFEELLRGWSIDPCEKEEDDATRGMRRRARGSMKLP